MGEKSFLIELAFVSVFSQGLNTPCCVRHYVVCHTQKYQTCFQHLSSFAKKHQTVQITKSFPIHIWNHHSCDSVLPKAKN